MGRKTGAKGGRRGRVFHVIKPISNSMTRVALPIFGSITSSGAGVLAGAFGMDPSGANKWTHYASIFDMFRVVGGTLRLVPVCTNQVVLNAMVLFAFDNDSSATPTAKTDIANYQEVTQLPAVWTSGAVRTFQFARPSRNGTMQGTTSLWLDEQNPSSSPGAVKFYGDGLSNSITYYSYELEYIVEFMYRS